MKKRNKKYIPLAEKARRKVASKLSLTYEFDMEYEIEAVNRAVADWHKQNGSNVDDYCPEWVAIDIYQQQDLIIALKMQQLQDPTYWQVGIDSYLYNSETDDIKTIPFSVELPEMSYMNLLVGGAVSIDRGNGIKTRWKGLQNEMIANWETEDNSGYEVVKSLVYIKAEAKFKDARMLSEFEYMIKMRDRGLLIQQLKDFGGVL